MTKRRSSEVIATRGSVKPAALLASFVAGPNAGPPACATAGATTKTATRHATARMRPPRTSGQRLRYKKLARRAVLSPGGRDGRLARGGTHEQERVRTRGVHRVGGGVACGDGHGRGRHDDLPRVDGGAC